MPIYEYRCEGCNRRSTALLPSWSAPDPVCPHCHAAKLRRLVSTFASPRGGSEDDGADFGAGDLDGEGEGDGYGDFGGGDFDDF